jgi:hypothetical protein
VVGEWLGVLLDKATRGLLGLPFLSATDVGEKEGDCDSELIKGEPLGLSDTPSMMSDAVGSALTGESLGSAEGEGVPRNTPAGGCGGPVATTEMIGAEEGVLVSGMDCSIKTVGNSDAVTSCTRLGASVIDTEGAGEGPLVPRTAADGALLGATGHNSNSGEMQSLKASHQTKPSLEMHPFSFRMLFVKVGGEESKLGSDVNGPAATGTAEGVSVCETLGVEDAVDAGREVGDTSSPASPLLGEVAPINSADGALEGAPFEVESPALPSLGANVAMAPFENTIEGTALGSDVVTTELSTGEGLGGEDGNTAANIGTVAVGETVGNALGMTEAKSFVAPEGLSVLMELGQVDNDGKIQSSNDSHHTKPMLVRHPFDSSRPSSKD